MFAPILGPLRLPGIIALIVWCSLCRQTTADLVAVPNTPRGQEMPFLIGPPIPNTSNLPAPLTGLPVSATHLTSLFPFPTSLSDGEKPDPQVPFTRPIPTPDNSPSPAAWTSDLDQPHRPLVMAYYPDWIGGELSPEEVDFLRYDWLDFAFAVPDSKFELAWDEEDAPRLLSRLVAAAHSTTTKVKLSIGGWTGSKYFSPAVATPETRRMFANNILAVYESYNLDGIDLDWEYPGHEGNNGNFHNPADTANFLAFLKVLRATLPPSAKISAAVQTLPFLGENGDPVTDTSEFGVVFDWILLMNYDTWESTSPPGPNAPLYDACDNSTQPASSAAAGVLAWTKSGFPVSKLVLGLPSYGYVQRSSYEQLRTRSQGRGHWHDHEDNEKHHIPEDEHVESEDWHHWGSGGGNTKDGGKHGDGGGLDDDEAGHPSTPENAGAPHPITVTDSDNQVQFRDLVQQGVLSLAAAADGTIQYNAAGGFERRWDSCSETPFLRSLDSGQIVTYDDTISLALKARFAREVGMMGVNIFDIHGDTDEGHLIGAIRGAMGV
ncbi:hypothetical protein D9611_002412 [Ephemerocybe angulata]|uniref:GH18 domain-containing protein n=1 Tax=Ephemerocybe angulata TaxID=980116 RepID=A0A8H5C2U6_9AGAR|nr:hypothetical protein D9611_002412 [Tulosesus angulatus]